MLTMTVTACSVYTQKIGGVYEVQYGFVTTRTGHSQPVNIRLKKSVQAVI